MFFNKCKHPISSSKTILLTFRISCSLAHVPPKSLSLWCLLIPTCSAFLIMFQRRWLNSWFSSWLMSYNWAGYLLLVSDERSSLIHSWSDTFDGTCFNLHGASLTTHFKAEIYWWGNTNRCLKEGFSISVAEKNFQISNNSLIEMRWWKQSSPLRSCESWMVICVGRQLWRGQMSLISSDSWRCIFFFKTASVSIILTAWWGLIIKPQKNVSGTDRLHPVMAFSPPGNKRSLIRRMKSWRLNEKQRTPVHHWVNFQWFKLVQHCAH